jgi:hypothetical protein
MVDQLQELWPAIQNKRRFATPCSNNKFSTSTTNQINSYFFMIEENILSWSRGGANIFVNFGAKVW